MVIGDASDSLLSHQMHTVYLHSKPVPYILLSSGCSCILILVWVFSVKCGGEGGGYRNQWEKSKRFVWCLATTRKSQ